jgi:diguanylate cyclase (GGDEF)-like protein
VRGADGAIRYYEGTVEDISERKMQERRMAHQATHDGLTGLPNRYLLQDRIEQAMRQAAREKTHVGVLFIDLDRLKHVNDTLGHQAGDELIRMIAQRLRRCLRTGDTVARIGGDEFVLLLPSLLTPAAIAQAKRRVLEATSAPCQIEGKEVSTSCSVGASLFPEDGSDVETLLKKADEAMYEEKQARR